MLAGPLLARMRDVIDFGLKHRVPTMFPGRTPVDAGGLMSYGYDRAALARRVAWYLDRVLKGTRPADLPVQQPTNLELVVNLRTAKAIGMTLPPALLQRADQVIE
jgi:putative ABC transport system substrate-binding protein